MQFKKGFGDLLPGKNPPKFLFLKPNPLVDGMIAQNPSKIKFSRQTPNIPTFQYKPENAPYAAPNSPNIPWSGL
jgi:hypothetical protein